MASKDVVRVAIVDPDDATREPLRNLLFGVDSVWLEAECARYEFFWDVLQQSKPDLSLVTLDSDTNRALALVAQLSQEMPQMPVLAVSARTDGPFILQTLRSGAREFLTQPVALKDLLDAMKRAMALPMSTDSKRISQPQRSMVVAVAGSRGGVGCTSLAINLGCAFAQNKNNTVALIDLDLALGDSDVCLDLHPEYTLADVAMNIERLDMQFLRRSLSKHETGLSLLPHPVQLYDVGLIQEDCLDRVIGLLRATYTHVVLDLSKGFMPTDFAAMKMADVVLLVAQLELTSLRNVVRLLLSFDSVEGLSEKVQVVINREGADAQDISIKRAEETIGRPIFWRLPNDSKSLLGSRNEGKPLVQYAPKTKIWAAIVGLAEQLCPQLKNGGTPHAAPAKKGLFGIF
jgi:pilus assembly protein CpaE